MIASDSKADFKKLDVIDSDYSEFNNLLEAQKNERAKLVANGRKPKVEVHFGAVTNMQSVSLEFEPDIELPSNFKDLINNSTALANDLQQNQSDIQIFLSL